MVLIDDTNNVYAITEEPVHMHIYMKERLFAEGFNVHKIKNIDLINRFLKRFDMLYLYEDNDYKYSICTQKELDLLRSNSFLGLHTSHQTIKRLKKVKSRSDKKVDKAYYKEMINLMKLTSSDVSDAIDHSRKVVTHEVSTIDTLNNYILYVEID